MTGSEPDLYAVLDLSDSAGHQEITAAFRRKLREHHPDLRNPALPFGPDPDEELRRIVEAYSVLRDPRRRAEYDRRRAGSVARTAARSVPVTVHRPAPPSEADPPIRAGPVRRHR
ncbi:J domain-containing protein [Rhodococcus rhodochrous]|uniref:Molecular chaperone DnaJ n=1 Tax=Rhodococcus rhodochrous KG-21 TaxID=1441923 RepID=A0A0M9WM35_RHORH|nr:J domain-containing protein [Rhodococcus rhodochrous]KOS54060.1 molecular chaperone DnaJ [Rhodococcus rhodochrous KG-21]